MTELMNEIPIFERTHRKNQVIMNKSILIILSFTCLLLISCSKKDSDSPSHDNTLSFVFKTGNGFISGDTIIGLNTNFNVGIEASYNSSSTYSIDGFRVIRKFDSIPFPNTVFQTDGIGSKTYSWQESYNSRSTEGDEIWTFILINNNGDSTIYSIILTTSSKPVPPIIKEPLHIYGTYFFVEYDRVPDVSGYVVDIATDQSFVNILPDYNNKHVESTGMFAVEGLNPINNYFVRMRSFNDYWSSESSEYIEFNTRPDNLLPNMDMEDWMSYPNFESPSPEGIWASANKIVDLNPSYYSPVLFKSDDSYSGNYAAKMVSATFEGMPLITGSLSTGIFTVNLNNFLKSLTQGVPYKSKPTRFQGYYKYVGVDGDSCEIRTTLSKWNPSTKKRDKVGEAVYRTTDLIQEYTYFDLEFVYFLSGDPDTINMVFASSAGGEYFVGGIGSTLYVDDFTLVFD